MLHLRAKTILLQFRNLIDSLLQITRCIESDSPFVGEVELGDTH